MLVLRMLEDAGAVGSLKDVENECCSLYVELGAEGYRGDVVPEEMVEKWW